MQESFPGIQGSTLGSLAIKSESPIQAFKKIQDPFEDFGYCIAIKEGICIAPSEEDTKYICVDMASEETASEEEINGDKGNVDSDCGVFIDDGELMKKVEIGRMETLNEVQSTGYVQVSFLPKQKQALDLSKKSEPETNPHDKGQEHEEESMQTLTPCECYTL